jgi:selenocysteine lyase/cysteine desulfurase
MSTESRKSDPGVSRRDFARLLTFGGVAPWLLPDGVVFAQTPLPATAPASPDEAFWKKVRANFLMPPDLAVMNAANLCPSSAPVLQRMYDLTKDMDRDPSPQNRRKMGEGKEAARKALADFLRVTPEEIVITRNTSEANNTVSSGLELKAGDEVLIFEENHPSNNAAWKTKSKRYGFTVKELPLPNPHPGMDHYVQAVSKAITANTKIVCITHLTNTNGDLFPAKEICRVAHERGVLCHVDGAQSFGLLDVDLSDISRTSTRGAATSGPAARKKWASCSSTRT